MTTTRTILVTGATGKQGSALIDVLLAESNNTNTPIYIIASVSHFV